MVEALLPIFNGPGVLGQRFGQFFGAQTLLSNLTVANGATIVILDPAGNQVTLNAAAMTINDAGGAGGTVPTVPPVGSANHWQFQAGAVVATPNASGIFTLTFPFAFATALDAVIVSNGNAAANPNQLTAVHKATAFGTSSVGIQVTQAATGAAITGAVEVGWIALGH
jgi:hypothetical protein